MGKSSKTAANETAAEQTNTGQTNMNQIAATASAANGDTDDGPTGADTVVGLAAATHATTLNAELPTPASPVGRSKKWLLYTALLLALVAVAGIAYHRHAQAVKQEQAYQADKATFARVEADMKIAYDAIVAQVGKPDVTHVYKDCSYTSRKFEQGDLSCGVGYGFGYAASDYPSAVSQARLAQNSILSGKAFFTKAIGSEISTLDPEDKRHLSATVSLMNSEDISCQIRFDYEKPLISIDYNAIKSDYASVYLLNCWKNMGKPIYPLAK